MLALRGSGVANIASTIVFTLQTTITDTTTVTIITTMLIITTVVITTIMAMAKVSDDISKWEYFDVEKCPGLFVHQDPSSTRI